MIYRLRIYKIIHLKVLLLAIVWLFSVFHVRAQDPEYRAQSLYLYKFSKYIFWPEDKITDKFRIGVFGNSPILKELELMASLKKAAGDLDFEIAEVDPETDNLTNFHIIYIASSKSRQINELNDLAANNPVLLVAEREGMASRGATISFIVLENGILKFEIDMDMLEQQNLEISDELLRLGFKI